MPMPTPQRLRMFPLGSVLFPSMVLPLHVFEPRYLQMISECEDADEPFGVVLIERGFEVGGGDQRHTVGTMARILETAALDEGRRALVAVGTNRFRVTEWLEDDPYPQAQVTGVHRPAVDTRLPIDELDRLLRRLLAVLSEAGVDVGNIDYELSTDPELAVDQLSTLAPLGAFDSQLLLETGTAAEQADLLATMLAEATEMLKAQMGGS